LFAVFDAVHAGREQGWKCDDTVSTSCGERQRYTWDDRFRLPRWQSHSTTALDGRRRTRPRAEAIATTCDVEVPNHSLVSTELPTWTSGAPRFPGGLVKHLEKHNCQRQLRSGGLKSAARSPGPRLRGWGNANSRLVRDPPARRESDENQPGWLPAGSRRPETQVATMKGPDTRVEARPRMWPRRK
jgi:hypothetical protein